MIDFPPDNGSSAPRSSDRAHSPHPYRPSVQQFTAFVLRDGRRAGFCWDEKPRCVHGHRLKTRDPQQLRDVRLDALVTCVHRDARGAAPCETRQYVALCTFGGSAAVRGKGERFWFCAEVTDAHVRRMRAEPMIFLERLSVLDCVLPGVSRDLLGATLEDVDGHLDERGDEGERGHEGESGHEGER